MFEEIGNSAKALYSSWEILTVLGLISICAWSLIIVTIINLWEASKGMEKGDSSENIFAHHALYCSFVTRSNLSERVRKRLTSTHSRDVIHMMEANVTSILVFSSLAPLIGLLGTVDGVITTFGALTSLGKTGSDALSSGISKALITTQGGLLVAIPSLLAGGILYRKVKKLSNRLRLAALEGTQGNIEIEKERGA